MSAELCQFFTPLWVAEALVESHFRDLDSADLVLEPSCGKGAFLAAIPAGVPAIGVEIDPAIAVEARKTGRPVIEGDFRTVALEVQPTAIIGNPPFDADLIDDFLKRCHHLLPDGGRCGFILPTYLFQTAHRVCGYAERWSVAQQLLPRNAFSNRMQTPLLFALFTKGGKALYGFALYREAADVLDFDKQYRDLIEATTGSLWRAVCELALKHLGGRATLGQIYQQLERNRPTRTRFWREKIRQTLRVYPQSFRPITDGEYALA